MGIGHEDLRNRVVLSVLSGKPVRIDKIRPDDKEPGLRDYEASLLRLVERVSNGTVIEISYTGTSFLLKPGIIKGGSVTHDCPLSRSIGYFLEPLLMLAPFAKNPLQLTLKGITTDDKDLSVDLIRTVTLPHLQLFGISEGLELKIRKRGAAPLGGGEVQFLCPVVRQLKILNFVEPGKIKRIRGIAHAVRVSPQFSHRMVEAARSVLNRYIPDIYIHTDVYKGEDSGKSPGFALTLLSESTTSAIYCSETVSSPGVTPEDVALMASRSLLDEIRARGCVDQKHQCLIMLLMVLGSEDVGLPVPPYYLHTTSNNFVDTSGRTVLLRGVNLSGDSKFPAGNHSAQLEGFWEGGEKGDVSFVGRPFPLAEADIHLERLKGWGMNLIRYVVCWEALEHAGPKMYDEAFIDYTIIVLRKCKEHGFRVFIDPHQDVWSRFSGGSGAPLWTLHACGLEPRNFTHTGSLIHCEYPSPEHPDPKSFGVMTWPTSYFRLPALTVFTLFWAGRDYAPKCIIDGVNIQDYLQSHMAEAYGHLTDRIRDAGDLLDECVIGWENINEPNEGLLGADCLTGTLSHQTLKKDLSPTPIQCFKLGMGKSQALDFYVFTKVGPIKNKTVTIEPKGIKAWLDPSQEPNGVSTRWGWQRDSAWKLGECVWAQHDVWDPATGNILETDYFKWSRSKTTDGGSVKSQDSQFSSRSSGKKQKVDFLTEYWLPYWRKWAKRIRQSHPEAIHFIQPPLFSPPPPMLEADLKGRVAYSPHFYDGLTMMTRHWNWFNSNTVNVLRKRIHVVQSFKAGEENIRKNFQQQLALFREDAQNNLGAYPVVLGETGTPFDVDEKRSYGMTHGGLHIGNHIPQQTALDASLNATDGTNVYSYAIWGYNPAHTWEWGDGFNLEDLSIWSIDDHTYRRHVKFEKLAKAAREGILPSVMVGQQEVTSEEVQELQSHHFGAHRTRTGGMNCNDDDSSTQEESLDGLPVPKALVQPLSTSWEFLVDGARAIYAFCRPYPVKTVGRPQSIMYDIHRARFVLLITVDSTDEPARASGEQRQNHGHGRKHQVPTEIYIPLTTFSSPPTLVPVPTEEDDQSASDPPGTAADCPHTPTESKHKAKKMVDDASKNGTPDDSKRTHSVQEAVSRLHLAFAANRANAVAGQSLHLISDAPIPLQIPDDVLDVQIDVDVGRIEFKGQMVLWYYDVPETGRRTYKMTVQKINPHLGAKERSGSGHGCVVM
ncbi:hypothetical protein FRB96_000290 [Tulasnella sp. 330]|nr:hypothetical protein FRB96_000290 [Tulasnella sp. 330]